MTTQIDNLENCVEEFGKEIQKDNPTFSTEYSTEKAKEIINDIFESGLHAPERVTSFLPTQSYTYTEICKKFTLINLHYRAGILYWLLV